MRSEPRIPGLPQDGTRTRPDCAGPSYGRPPEPPRGYVPMPSDEPTTGYPPRVKQPPPPGGYGRPEEQPASAYVPKPPDEPPMLSRPRATGAYRPQPPAPGHPETHEQPGTHDHHDTHPVADEPAGSPGGGAAPRQNQRNLTSEAKADLFQRLRDYIASPEDPVAFHRENGHVHGTPRFLPWHRQFLLGFERWQRSRINEASNFLPLAFWNPADSLPTEFSEPDQNGSIPSMPLPPRLLVRGGLGSLDYEALSQMLEGHHNTVHNAIGGAMVDLRVAPRAPIFWLLHAFYDNTYATWEAWAQR